MTKLIDQYIDYLRYEKNYSSHTEISYLTDLTQFAHFLEEEHPEVQLSKVDLDVIRLWMVSLMDAGISARSVNRKLSTLKSFYKHLLRIGTVAKNPAINIVGPRMKKPIPSFVNDKDMESLLEDLDFESEYAEYRNVLILELLYVTGIRRAELIGIKDKDLDFFSKTIQVTGKRNKQRLIPLSQAMCEKLRLFVENRNSDILQPAEALFVRENGQALYPALVHKIISTQLENISTLSKTSPHVLRHTFATSMLNNGADINAVKEILGHSSLAATEVYAHTSFEELKNIYKQAHPRA